jgi:hypothetical protein
MTTAIEGEIGNKVFIFIGLFSDDSTRKEGDCGGPLNVGSESAPFLPSSGVFVPVQRFVVG